MLCFKGNGCFKNVNYAGRTVLLLIITFLKTENHYLQLGHGTDCCKRILLSELDCAELV